MIILGLTGGIGSGKSSVAREFAASGIPVLDADQIARDVIEPGTEGNQKILKVFGKEVFDDDNRLDRARVRDYVFQHPDALKQLESIIHPLVVSDIKTQVQTLKEQGKTLVVVEIPLLVEAKLQSLVDKIVVVDLPVEMQQERAMRRDEASPESIERIMAQQVDRQTRLRHADYVIDNSTTLAALQRQVHSLTEFLNTQSH